MPTLNEDQKDILNKQIDKLSEKELFIIIPLTERLNSFGP